MFKRTINDVLGNFGYQIQKVDPCPGKKAQLPIEPPPVDPVWPLPRRSGGLSDEEVRKEFQKHDLWHYAYKFEGGLSFKAHHTVSAHNSKAAADAPDRPLQRFRHFMPYLVQAQNGSLKGKRVLDIACNSGFWSIQCALMGAEVTGFDGRAELIEQANLVKSIVGLDNLEFRVLDFWDMNTQSLGGTFDIVLNLGILYHLPNPLKVLELTKSMAREHILLDTVVYPFNDSIIKLRWQEPYDIGSATSSGIVALPSASAINLMLKDIRITEGFEVPLRSNDLPREYLEHRRSSWLVKV